MSKKSLALGALAATCGLTLAYEAHRAWAAGIPPTNTLTYTGTLLTFGQPDNSNHQMVLALYITGQSSTTPVCQTATTPVTCVSGQFTIALPSNCVPFVHANPSLEVEVTIDGTAMGMTSLGAVPYAVEADTASNAAAGSAIATSIAALQAQVAVLQAPHVIETFTSAGAFTTSATSTTSTVYQYTVVGGGAGAATSIAGGSSGGGGAGASGQGTFSGIAPSTALTVAVGGAGGSAAGGGTSSISGPGLATITATGGSPGSCGSTSQCQGGAGGTVSGATIPFQGQHGQPGYGGIAGEFVPGAGGNSIYPGGGAGGGTAIATGYPASYYGCGGGGGANGGPGGAGSPGIVIITQLTP